MKKLSRFGFLMALLFIGCSDDSGNNSKTDVLSADDVLESIPKVESFKDLPNCSKNREDSIMVVLDEEIAYGCVDKHWIALGELHENMINVKAWLPMSWMSKKNFCVLTAVGMWQRIVFP